MESLHFFPSTACARRRAENEFIDEIATYRNTSPPVLEIPSSQGSLTYDTTINHNLNSILTPVQFLNDLRPPRTQNTILLSFLLTQFSSTLRILTYVVQRELRIPLETLRWNTFPSRNLSTSPYYHLRSYSELAEEPIEMINLEGDPNPTFNNSGGSPPSPPNSTDISNSDPSDSSSSYSDFDSKMVGNNNLFPDVDQPWLA